MFAVSDDADEDDDDDEDEEGDDDEGADDEELSLAEVYNEHLEEDNSDYVEEGEDEEEDDEVDSDEEDAVAPADANAAAPEQPGEGEYLLQSPMSLIHLLIDKYLHSQRNRRLAGKRESTTTNQLTLRLYPRDPNASFIGSSPQEIPQTPPTTPKTPHQLPES